MREKKKKLLKKGWRDGSWIADDSVPNSFISHAEVSNSEQIISIYENSLFLGDK